MVTMEAIREHSRVRDAVTTRVAAYEANLNRVGQALRGGGLQGIVTPLPFGSLETLANLNCNASLRRARDLVGILLAGICTVHLTNLEDFQHLFALCPNLISFKSLESRHPLGLREPERGIPAVEYDLFVEQNLFENDFAQEPKFPLFEIMPLLLHVICGAVHPRLRKFARVDGEITFNYPTQPLPFLDEKSAPSLLHCVSRENLMGRIILWVTCGLNTQNIPHEDSHNIFQVGIQKWNCIEHFREFIVSRQEPKINKTDKFILKLILGYFEPLLDVSGGAIQKILDHEIASLATASNIKSCSHEDTSYMEPTTGRTSARINTNRTSRRRLLSPRLHETAVRFNSPNGVLCTLLQVFDALIRRVPESAHKFLDVYQHILEVYPFNPEIFAGDESDNVELKATTTIAMGHFASSLMAFTKSQVDTNIFSAISTRFKLIDGPVKPILQISLWDAYLRCASSKETTDVDEAVSLALGVLAIDSAAITQNVNLETPLIDNSPDNIDWVRSLISLKLGALQVLASKNIVNKHAEDSIRHLIIRLPYFRLDLWVLKSSTSTPDSATLKSTFLLSIIWGILSLINTNSISVLSESPSAAQDYYSHKHSASGDILSGWRQLIRFLEAEVLPWIIESNEFQLPCWRLLTALFDWMTLVLTLHDSSRAEESYVALYLASHLLSDASPWLQVLLIGTRKACESLCQDLAFSIDAYNAEYSSEVIETTLGSAVGVIYQMVFREKFFVKQWKQACAVASKASNMAASRTLNRGCLDGMVDLYL